MEEFKTGIFSELLGKPYLVYDIETSLIGSRLEDVEFYIGHSMEEDGSGKMIDNYILPENLKDFVEKMLNFDGYII